MNRMRALILTVAMVFGYTISAHAVPILFNSNYYEFIRPTSVNDWFSGNTAANSSTYLGFSGHLATITSAAENDFLITTLQLGRVAGKGPGWVVNLRKAGWLDPKMVKVSPTQTGV